MLAVRPILALVLALMAAACAGSRPVDRPSTPDRAPSSSVYVYLDRLPRELDGLRARIAGIRALGEDGTSIDLDVRVDLLGDPAERRQRLLAAGALAPGRYLGLDVTVAGATIELEGAVRTIEIDPAPRRIDVPFVVESRQAVVLTARMAPDALVDPRRFVPQFTAGPPGEIADDAVAIASVPDEGVLIKFHKVTGEVVDVLRTCDGPFGVAYDAITRRAYVACEADDAVEVFDIVRGRREQIFPLSFGDRPRGLALTRDGATLAVVNAGSSTVAFLTAPRLTERTRIDVAREPLAIVPFPGEDRMAVFSREGNAITLIAAAAARAVATIPTEESGPVYGAVDPRDGRMYVVHRRSPYLSIVDLREVRVVGRAYVGPGGTSVAVDSRTGRIYVGRSGAGAVEIFDPASLLAIDRLPGDGDAANLVIDPQGDRLYVAVAERDEVRSYRLPGGERPVRTDTPAPVAWITVAGQDGRR